MPAIARYSAVVLEEIDSGFDLMNHDPYSLWEGLVHIPEHVPIEEWRDYSLLKIGERFKREPVKLVVICSSSLE